MTRHSRYPLLAWHWMFIWFLLCIMSRVQSQIEERIRVSPQSDACARCHQEKTPGLYQQWGSSKHQRARVGCFECHQANPEKDVDAFEHHGQHIATLVTPRDCGRCHSREEKEFARSRHALAADTAGSAASILSGDVAGNRRFFSHGYPRGTSPVKVSSCWQCHGGAVKVNPGGRLDPASHPASGIGRINPDGSRGACNACHNGHSFASEQVRHPDTCGKCHSGPDHAQWQIYKTSKHGIAFAAHASKMGMNRNKWIVGEDYSAAPTCATCHMSATSQQATTHDVGARISWNNRGPVSIHSDQADLNRNMPTAKTKWKIRRRRMNDVCRNCHDKNWVSNFFVQYDAQVALYNDKYGMPGKKLMELAEPLRADRPLFSHRIDWIWFEITHRSGRTARIGAAMMSPDQSQWQGFYKLAKSFHTEFLPTLRTMGEEGLRSSAEPRRKVARALLKALDEVEQSANHRWYRSP